MCAKLQKFLFGHTESNSLMTNVEITRSPVQKEKPKPNCDMRSVFNEMSVSKKVSTKKKRKNGKKIKDDDKGSLLMFTFASFIRNAPVTRYVLFDISS